jgi:hypothetical protein
MRISRVPLYASILAVSLIACIIRYRLIAFDLTRSLPCIAKSSFGEPINFKLLLGVLLVCSSGSMLISFLFVETCSPLKIHLDWLAKPRKQID